MPWIRTVPAEEATGPLKEIFEPFRIERGRMFTPYEVLTNNGAALAAVTHLNDAVRFGPSDLTRAQREMIAALTSALNSIDDRTGAGRKDVRTFAVILMRSDAKHDGRAATRDAGRLVCGPGDGARPRAR